MIPKFILFQNNDDDNQSLGMPQLSVPSAGQETKTQTRQEKSPQFKDLLDILPEPNQGNNNHNQKFIFYQ